jgi:dipeptidyl aminopeptidase/acylaminoacyl peptidase
MSVSRRASAFVFAVLAAASPLAAQAPTVTLEALLAPPFPSELVAAPSGGIVAWVQKAAGVRNVWAAGPPDYHGRQLTSYTADDGQDLGDLAIAPDGRTVLYVRGASPNRRGENPNPASDPAGAEQVVWRVAVEGGEPVRIGPGAAPAISPRGDLVAYVQGGQIWSAPLAGDGAPAQLVKARGTLRTLRWSPDGARLAFVSTRGDHAFVGVYELAGKSLRWLAPSVDRDDEPVWSPDGARIAFLRVPASSRMTLFRAVREGRPWSIQIAEVASGAVREVWRADEGAGSVFQGIVAETQLFWAAGDRIVFPWEKSGWLLLYAVPARGGAAALLTPGEFEVEHAAFAPGGRDVVFSSNQDDRERRHLWRVAVTGGPPAAVTRGTGIEWAPTPTADGRALAYLRSDARTPAHAVVSIDGGAARELVPGWLPADFPSRALVEPQPVRLAAADGREAPAHLFLPPNLRPGERRPAVIFLHGGSRRQMLLGFHHSAYYHPAYALNQYLASRGFVVLALNYRGGIGYGLDFRAAPGQGATGGSELYDVLGAGLYLRGRPEVDPARIGLWGGSYGGYLTALGLARASALFAAGVDLHGVHDWNVGIQTFVPEYEPLRTPEESRLAFMASPMASLDGWRSPVLVIHGDDDRNVAFAETVKLVEALRQRGVEVEQLVLPDEVHTFLRHASWLAAYRATADFLERKLAAR